MCNILSPKKVFVSHIISGVSLRQMWGLIKGMELLLFDLLTGQNGCVPSTFNKKTAHSYVSVISLKLKETCLWLVQKLLHIQPVYSPLWLSSLAKIKTSISSLFIKKNIHLWLLFPPTTNSVCLCFPLRKRVRFILILKKNYYFPHPRVKTHFRYFHTATIIFPASLYCL